MSAIFPFTPTTAAPFQFQPVLDGLAYNASVPWSIFGQRYYLKLVALDGTVIWYGGITGSPTGAGLMALSWANGIVTATTTTAHGYKIAKTIALTIVGCTPAAYNGAVQAFITGASTFRYPLTVNPGLASVLGAANFNINLIGGVQKEDGTFFASSLVFRVPANQFEVSP